MAPRKIDGIPLIGSIELDATAYIEKLATIASEVKGNGIEVLFAVMMAGSPELDRAVYGSSLADKERVLCTLGENFPGTLIEAYDLSQPLEPQVERFKDMTKQVANLHGLPLDSETPRPQDRGMGR